MVESRYLVITIRFSKSSSLNAAQNIKSTINDRSSASRAFKGSIFIHFSAFEKYTLSLLYPAYRHLVEKCKISKFSTLQHHSINP